MSQRATRRAGILKTRDFDAPLQKTLDSIIERVEVLDGLRGDALDQAVTYRDLGLTPGFVVGAGAGGGTPQIIVTPGGGEGSDGPGIGPAAAPSALSVTDTFLALFLNWTNPSFNVQHIEVWRADTDNLSLAVFIGTTVSSQFVDYVGASASFYYWVRAVGTDGTFSAFNATAGTLGTTGIDPSDFELELNIAASNLDATLTTRINLIDDPTTGLVDRMGVAEGDIVAGDARTTLVEADVAGINVTVGGHTSSIDANTTNVATNQSSITVLTDGLDVAEDGIADNVISIIANSSSILNLEAAIGALDAEGGQTWEFASTDEGFTAVNATITNSATAIVFEPSAADPQLLSETISISGGIYTQVVMRIRQTVGSGTWEGSCSYATGGHTISGSFIKSIPDPGLVLSEWKTLTWDMAALDVGGTDWIDSTITQLRFDIVSDNAGKFEIDWILIAKFSTSAVADALEALDVRVTVNEQGVFAAASDITALEGTVDDTNLGVTANANAISALTIDVGLNDDDITANAAAVLALQVTVDDPTTGVTANAGAITVLETNVSSNQGSISSQASSITQLTASIGGGFGSLVNPFLTLNEGFGSSYDDSDVQAYADLGGRTGVAAWLESAANVTETVQTLDGTRLKVEPRAIYEVKFSIYHTRPTDAGSFLIGFESYAALTGGLAQLVTAVNEGVLGAATTTPVWLQGTATTGDDEWLDVTCYILGPDASPAACPDMFVNNATDNTVLLYQQFNDGFQTDALYPYVELKIKNFNASPTWGDDTTTTLRLTDLQVRRVESSADLFAAVEVQASVQASDIGDLHALYAVKVEINANGDPYVAGFGLAVDVIPPSSVTSAFGVRADQFFIASPNDTSDTIPPFIVGIVDSVATVGINGQLIVDGTINGISIIEGAIGAREITVIELSALSANMGVLQSGRITTGQDGTAPLYEDQTSFRVEIQDTAATIYPLWYGSGAKSAGTGRFYVDQNGNVVVKGLLDAGMIKQSFFTPADGNNSFRIAVEYPNQYSGGVYTGKMAHLSPIFSVNETPNANITILPFGGSGIHNSAPITFLGPTNSTATQYGRLGTNSEMLSIDIAVAARPNAGSVTGIRITLQYKYDDSGDWLDAYFFDMDTGKTTSIRHSQIFITREASFSTIQLRANVFHSLTLLANASTGTLLTSLSFTATTPNFGTADATVTGVVASDDIANLPDFPQFS